MEQATCVQVRAAQPMGVYQPTAIDAQKAAAEFRLTSIGKKNAIVWSDGRREMVSDARLSKLQAAHAWACDF